ncbi:MAG TPA: hypothetical protein ENN19_02505 [Chloroflexi bacterium]|nr:hypothetical protein [Chloroflexota bacterium]
MKSWRSILLTTVVGLVGLFLALFFVVDRSEPTLAAPNVDVDTADLFGMLTVPDYQTIECTINTTSTRDYLGDNHSPDRAANLANYNNLRLAYGNVPDAPIKVEPDEDYFVLANATPGSTYRVKAEPSGAGNYNLGIVVFYNKDLDPIVTDANPLDGNSASVQLTPGEDETGPYYFKVYQISAYCTGGTYSLNVTVTTPPGADLYEPNDTMETAYFFPIATSASAKGANFVPSREDEDWFAFYVQNGQRYRATTSNLSGVDTYLVIFDRDGNEIASDANSGGGFASRIEWTARYRGYYYIRVTNQVDVSDSNDTYDLSVAQIDVSPGATNTPVPTPSSPNADRCDRRGAGNHDFDHACIISPNVAETFNFVPPPYGGIDNDYYKMWVKPGLLYECRTSNLSPGVDPNLIVYDQNRNPIGGNDDVAPGNFNSYFAYYATYEGWLYLLVGTGDRVPPNVNDSDYTFRCDIKTGEEDDDAATSTPRPGETAAPPRTPTPTRQPPTATPRPEISFRVLTTPTPVSVSTPVPSSRFIPIRVLIYYDGNNDFQPGAGEGIANISVQAYEAATGQFKAQGVTDEQGNLEMTVASSSPVRISVPFFGFSQLVASEKGASIYLRVPPQSG